MDCPKTISPTELGRKLGSGEHVYVIDVREPDEFREWHIPGSKNMPQSVLVAGVADYLIHGDALVVTVCEHGKRSEVMRRLLKGRGYNVVSLEGGINLYRKTIGRANASESRDR